MPVGRRKMTDEELKFLDALADESLTVSSPLWRARRDLGITVADHAAKVAAARGAEVVGPMITMQQAEMLRTLVGKLLAKRFPIAGPKFAESEIGQFPFVRKEQGAA